VDKRIDLAWTAPASADVKDYLVYRTATAGADTTGKQVGITAATTLSDGTPSYAEWFYRVFARDQAHNVGPASNEASAVSPQISGPDPVVTTSIHQNPALPRYADVVVVSDSLLMQPPAVSVESPSVPAGAAVTMVAVPGAAATYRGSWVFTESGVHTVRTSVVTAGGSPFAFVRSFTATLVGPGGGEARSAGGLATLQVPAGAVRQGTFFLMEELAEAGGRSGQHVVIREAAILRIEPVGALAGEAVLEIAYEAADHPGAGRIAEPGRLAVARIENGVPVPLPGEMIPERGVVRAPVTRLGEFTLVQDPGTAGGGASPLRFALHPNRPNPFRGRTTLHYDLPAAGPVRLAIYDVAGRLVTTLRDGPAPAGEHRNSWDGRDDRGAPAAAGVYFARVTAGPGDRILKIVLLR
jgi:hypothetical protein